MSLVFAYLNFTTSNWSKMQMRSKIKVLTLTSEQAKRLTNNMVTHSKD